MPYVHAPFLISNRPLSNWTKNTVLNGAYTVGNTCLTEEWTIFWTFLTLPPPWLTALLNKIYLLNKICQFTLITLKFHDRPHCWKRSLWMNPKDAMNNGKGISGVLLGISMATMEIILQSIIAGTWEHTPTCWLVGTNFLNFSIK